MKLTYRQAILSFCEDLTDPDARPLPIGTLLIGQLDESRLAAAIVIQQQNLDPFAQEHISDALALVREHIDREVKKKPDAPSAEILHTLYSTLRNSLFVSSIGDEKVVEVDEPFEAEVVRIASLDLLQAITDAAPVQPAPPARPSQPQITRAASSSKKKRVASQRTEVWALQAAG